LLLAAIAAISVPALAQTTAVPLPPSTAPAPDEKVVTGATPDRVAQVERCSGHKFESVIEIDPVKHRSTRVKLCANPGATDADWAKTLRAAIAQIEQRDLPPAAKDKLIGELKAELAKYAPGSKLEVTRKSAPFATTDVDSSDSLIAPAERYETSTLPPLTPKKAAPIGAPAIVSRPIKPMSIRIKCLERGEGGAGSTCDFFDRNTVLAVNAVEGLEGGGTLRFLRKGEAHGEATLAPMKAGQSIRVKLPTELCRSISYSKVEIELLGPNSAGMAAARLGPYGLRC
jgi:hypothetical protein